MVTEIRFKDISFFSSGGNFIPWRGSPGLCNFGERHYGEHSLEARYTHINEKVDLAIK